MLFPFPTQSRKSKDRVGVRVDDKILSGPQIEGTSQEF